MVMNKSQKIIRIIENDLEDIYYLSDMIDSTIDFFWDDYSKKSIKNISQVTFSRALVPSFVIKLLEYGNLNNTAFVDLVNEFVSNEIGENRTEFDNYLNSSSYKNMAEKTIKTLNSKKLNVYDFCYRIISIAVLKPLKVEFEKIYGSKLS